MEKGRHGDNPRVSPSPARRVATLAVLVLDAEAALGVAPLDVVVGAADAAGAALDALLVAHTDLTVLGLPLVHRHRAEPRARLVDAARAHLGVHHDEIRLLLVRL